MTGILGEADRLRFSSRGIDRAPGVHAFSALPDSGRAPFLLKAAAFSIFFFPSNMVLAPAGAVGTVPLMLCVVAFLMWFASASFGLHDPWSFRHPGRIGLGFLWIGTCITYVALFSGLTGGSSVTGRAAADRWLVLVVASTGIALAVAEGLRTLDDFLDFVRALLAGATFCSLVALIQFVTKTNPMDWVASAMPGFTDNGGNTPFQERGSLVRVAGSTFHSIELAVVSAMLLPLSIWRGIYDRQGRNILHWCGTALLVFAIASTVSRSGVLGVVVGLFVLVPFLPRVARQWLLLVAPAGLAGLFLAVPGLVGTLTGSLTAGESDPSITTRTDNFPRVAGMIAERPVFGTGPGNFEPPSAIFILDNQYLNSAVNMGLIGLACVFVYLLFPGLTLLLAAIRAADPRLKAAAGAVAAGCLVAGVCSLTFDSLSFPVFALTYPLLLGMAGTLWMLVRREIEPMARSAPAREDTHGKHATTLRGGDQWIR